MTLLTALIYRHLRAQLQRGAHFFVYRTPTEPAPRPDQTDAPTSSAASAPLRLDAFDHLFRALALFGLLEWAGVLWNVLTHPATVGIAGQSYGVRLFMTLAVGPGILGGGALLVWRVPRHVVGRYLILVGLTIIAAQYDFYLATPTLSVLALELFLLVGTGLALPSLIYLMLHFPSGQVYPPRFAPWVTAYAMIKAIGVMLEIMASTRRLVVVDLPINPLLVPALVPYHSLIAIMIGPAGLSLPLGAVAGLVSMAWRYRAAGERERQQIKWVAWAGGLFLVFLPIQITLFANGALTQSAALFNLTAIIGGSLMLALVAAIGIAILRYRLFDIDILINRTLVYGGLTTVVVGLYAVLVGGLGALFESSGNVAISLVATGLVAVMFQPLRERLQRSINRLMYGDRDDPYAVLSRLGQRLEATLAPETVLPTIVETIAQALRLPYVAIELATDTVAIGAPVADGLRLPLTYQREVVGHLVLASRAPGEAFTPADRRLLEDIAHQAGVGLDRKSTR
ncbi:MAG: hypothetical protein KIT87_28625, partial [Anaerolineae bacterium]|nr:hypothetical protein [Anaerolineae bacterium]